MRCRYTSDMIPSSHQALGWGALQVYCSLTLQRMVTQGIASLVLAPKQNYYLEFINYSINNFWLIYPLILFAFSLTMACISSLFRIGFHLVEMIK